MYTRCNDLKQGAQIIGRFFSREYGINCMKGINMFNQKITKSLAVSIVTLTSLFNITPALADGSELPQLDDDARNTMLESLGGSSAIVNCKVPTEGSQCFPEDENCQDQSGSSTIIKVPKRECIDQGGIIQ